MLISCQTRKSIVKLDFSSLFQVFTIIKDLFFAKNTCAFLLFPVSQIFNFVILETSGHFVPLSKILLLHRSGSTMEALMITTDQDVIMLRGLGKAEGKFENKQGGGCRLNESWGRENNIPPPA
jgi:hypothetical protein